MTTDKRLPVVADRRLIEDYLPIEAISAEARREKSVRQGHISTLHLWWARRPLVACHAAVLGARVPVSLCSHNQQLGCWG
jgi:putative DNA methylase